MPVEDMTWTWVWIFITGRVTQQGADYNKPWTPYDFDRDWQELVATDSLVAYMWTGKPRVLGDNTVEFIISVKT